MNVSAEIQIFLDISILNYSYKNWIHCLRCAAAPSLQRSVQIEAKLLRFQLKHQKALNLGRYPCLNSEGKEPWTPKPWDTSFNSKACVWSIHSFSGKSNSIGNGWMLTCTPGAERCRSGLWYSNPSIHFKALSSPDLDGCNQGQGQNPKLYSVSHA